MLKTKDITTLGLFLAIGLILPYITGHAFGIPGTVLLPMHIPVILIGFLYGPLIGVILGVTIPTLSFLLTGMPSAIMLPIMLVELGIYGFVCGLLSNKFKLNSYISLLSAMIAGRIGYLLTLYFLTDILGMESFGKVASVITAVVTGLPGIAIQIVFIPILVKVLRGFIRAEQTV